MKKISLAGGFILLFCFVHAQKKSADPVKVDKNGVMRWTKDNSEVALFGVNYTVPFAYGYRSVKALGQTIEDAIDADVYHLHRLGMSAFRVHVWDVEISDSLGNLLDNDHLRLFDYLVKKLKEYNIKILITPIAFWGSGYPEPDIKTIGFSSVYGKGPSVVLEASIKAQENYVKQFFRHVNPYTGLSYLDDPDFIAMEINNEPHHSGTKEKATEYVNRLASAVKSTGWTKPIFYNISESPLYADAVVKAQVDGHSFQWYPTGLVANHERKGNFLPNVAAYTIPMRQFPDFNKRSLMVYEFDAGDVMQPIMYPAMSKAFRDAGFQWATQFAYDPMATAYANTEYQTHYLNLAYTPAKAISLLIASRIFQKLPRAPKGRHSAADSVYGDFKVSYVQQLSEMNSNEEFYNTGSTSTIPKDLTKLKHIAGVGNSAVVKYEGTGAYFLDKISEDVWRLEVMPDVIHVSDPFAKASPKKRVTHILWNTNSMTITLPGTGNDLEITSVSDNVSGAFVTGKSFSVKPGVYAIHKRNARPTSVSSTFYAPATSFTAPIVVHQPFTEVMNGNAIQLNATIAGLDNSSWVSVETRNSSNKWKTVSMQPVSGYQYSALIPAEQVTPGILNYRIMIKKESNSYTFPGGHTGDPYAWDEYRNESWQTIIAGNDAPLMIFDAATDRDKLMWYMPNWRNTVSEYIMSGKPQQLALKATINSDTSEQFMGWQFYFTDKIAGRKNDLSKNTRLVVRIRSEKSIPTTISLINVHGDSYGTEIVPGPDWKDIVIPLSTLKKNSYILLPRPYPGFLPLRFPGTDNAPFNITLTEKIEFRFGDGVQLSPSSGIEVIGAWLE